MIGLVAYFAIQQACEFAYDRDHLYGVYVNGACVLGEDVHTNGAYIIGSEDGSDAQGHSIISVGSANGRMKSDNPRLVTPPPFTLRFKPAGSNRLTFSATIGPAPQNMATMSMPFDFGRKMFDRFRFSGQGYRIFSSENNGAFSGNGNTYKFIKAKDIIRLLDGTVIGKVGGAATDAPTLWGEVDGPYARVRVTVLKSSHYVNMVFMNHPGTHNLELGFGHIRKGDVVDVEGTIDVQAKPGPDEWDYDASSEFNHQMGRAEADGWSARVGDEREKYMCFGPYATEIGTGPRMATFQIMLDNVNFDDAKILTIDVVDARSGTVLAQHDLTRHSFTQAMTYQNFGLRFFANPGAKLEFRTLWHGASYTRIKQVIIQPINQ